MTFIVGLSAENVKTIGHVLKTALRANRAGGFATRYGGEEFVLVFSGATIGWAEQKSNEIRKTIQAKKVATVYSILSS